MATGFSSSFSSSSSPRPAVVSSDRLSSLRGRGVSPGGSGSPLTVQASRPDVGFIAGLAAVGAGLVAAGEGGGEAWTSLLLLAQVGVIVRVGLVAVGQGAGALYQFNGTLYRRDASSLSFGPDDSRGRDSDRGLLTGGGGLACELVDQWEQRSWDGGGAVEQQLDGGVALLQEELLTLLANHRLEVEDLSAAIGRQLHMRMINSYNPLLGGGPRLHFLFGRNLDLDPDGLGLKVKQKFSNSLRRICEGLTSGGLTSGGLTSGDLVSGGLTSGGLVSGGLTSGGLASEGLRV
ncbi:hypothetical protein NQZ68_034692 [Dissostichus eleginoides]|nr:hypothetical protein NQZ68_034692 [Dissostichus eleginoides]